MIALLPNIQNSQELGFQFTISKEIHAAILEEIVTSETEIPKNHQVFGSSKLIYFPDILGMCRMYKYKRAQLTKQAWESINKNAVVLREVDCSDNEACQIIVCLIWGYPWR